MSMVKSITEAHSIFYQCYQCGICSGSCPKSLINQNFIPRRMVFDAIQLSDSNGELSLNENLTSNPWQCITCGKCQVNCPQNIDILSLVLKLRKKSKENFVLAHANFLEPIYSLMLGSKIKDKNPARLNFIEKDVKIKHAKSSDTLFFTGCSLLYDVIFREDVGFNGKKSINNAIRILNFLGIEPSIEENELCCGHDLYWQGNEEAFKKLAERNYAYLKNYKRIIVSCPECYRTLAVEYKNLGYELNVFHISEVLNENISNLLKLNESNAGKGEKEKVAYHDSCRLARFMNVYDEPRKVLSALGFGIAELEMNREQSLCCGISAWVNCDYDNKKIRELKLEQVKRANVNKLIVPCPKCEIHLKCLEVDKSAGDRFKDIEIISFPDFVAEKIKEAGNKEERGDENGS